MYKRQEHLQWRLLNGQLPANVDPKVAVVMIGTNNTGQSMHPAAETAAGITRVVEILRDRRPDTKVLLLGIFPRDEKADGENRKRNSEINELIAKLDDGKHIHFMNIGEKFLLPDGTISKEVMPDFLHPSAASYEIWVEAIEEKLKELGGW